MRYFGFLSFLLGLGLLGYGVTGLILKGDILLVMIAFLIGMLLVLYGSRIANYSKEHP